MAKVTIPSRVIIPSGMELIELINSGVPICNNCGAIMDREEDPNGGCDILVCPGCNDTIDEMDYEYDDSEE